MAACETCGANTLLMVNVVLGAQGPTYTYRCLKGHITTTDFRSPPQDQGLRASDAADAPATLLPSPPCPADDEVAGSPPSGPS